MSARGRINSQRVLQRLSSDESMDESSNSDSEYSYGGQGPHDDYDDQGPHDDYDDQGPHDYEQEQTEALETAEISIPIDQQSNNNFTTSASQSASSSQTEDHNGDKELTLIEVHNSISRLIKQKMGGLDKRVTAIEHLVAKNITTKKKERPKPPVRKEVRLTYNLLKESEDSDFRGYDFSPSVPFTHERNKAITKKLMDVVKASNKEFSSKDIRNAAYTYYKSLGKEHRAKSSGKYDETVVTKRRRERFNRKVTQRCTEFQKLSYAEEDRKKWEKVLVPEMISSDESDTDEQGKSIFSVKELRWRSDRVNNFFIKLDDNVEKRKSDQAIRQSKARIRGKKVSTRSPPISAPKWSMK